MLSFQAKICRYDIERKDVYAQPFLKPTAHALEQEEQREEVRDWVLSTSLDQKVDKTIDKRPCESCGTSIYAASLKCYQCDANTEPCIVTGMS